MLKVAIKNNFKNHWFILIPAILIGFLIALPTISSIFKIGLNNFKGIYPIFSDDEDYYLAYSQDVIDGHFQGGNIYLSEYKNQPYIQPPLAEILFAFEAKLFHLSVPAIFVINDFIFTVVGIILIYLLFFKITKSKWLSSISSSLFYLLFLFAFGRPVNPQFSSLFLFLGMLFIWQIISGQSETNKLIKFNLGLAVAIGLSIYLYPYYWTTLFVVYIINLLFIFYQQKNFKQIFKNIVPFFAVLIILVLPYLINLIKALASPTYIKVISRYGLLTNHWPACYFNVALIFLTTIVLLLARKEINQTEKFFSYSLLIGGLILNWQNVLTGKYLQFSSHYYPVTVLFCFIIFAIIINSIKDKIYVNKKLIGKYLAFLFLILAIFSLIAYQQKGNLIGGLSLIAGTEKLTMVELQNKTELFNWFNQNTPVDSVIYSLSENYSALLPIYTHNNLYSWGYAGCFIISDQEIEDRWIRQNIFKDKLAASDVIESSRTLWLNKYIDNFQNKEIRRKIIYLLTRIKLPETKLIPEQEITRVLDKFNQVKQENLETSLKKYTINYILVDLDEEKNRGLEEKLSNYNFIEFIKRIGDNNIYQVN